jgi:hypothetical protein
MRIRVGLLTLMIVAAVGIVGSLVRGAVAPAVVLSGVAFLALAAVVVLAPSGLPARIRWPLLAAVLVVGVTANAALRWLQASGVRGGWFGGTRVEPAAAYLSPGLHHSWVRVMTAIGMLLTAALFGAALGPLPRRRSPVLAIVVGILAVPLVAVAVLDAVFLVAKIRATNDLDAKVPLEAWLYLAAAAMMLMVGVLAAQRAGAAVLAAPGALLLMLPALLAAHRAVVTLPAPEIQPTAGGNVAAPVLAQEIALPEPAVDVVTVAVMPIVLVGAALIVLGCLRAARAVNDARPSGTPAG